MRAPYGLTFETFSPTSRSEHLRADVALFVGFVGPRRERVDDLAKEEHLRDWLRLYGFGKRAEGLEKEGKSIATLTHVPVPIDGWGTFDALFAWDRRPIRDDVAATSYLGAAVRAFFAQGGRKAYVVRVGSPWGKAEALARDAIARENEREERLAELIPEARAGHVTAPTDRETWRGIEHVIGLPDVSFVLVPDLPDVVDAIGAVGPLIEPPAAVEEVFAECSAEVVDEARETLIREVPPPACDDASLRRWAEIASAAVGFLRRHRREAELVLAIPLMLEDGAIGRPRISAENPLARFYRGDEDGGETAPWLRVKQSSLGRTRPALEGFTSAFLQLATPWVKTLGSANSPGELEPPDGTLAGVLARNALARGTFRSAAGMPVPFVFDFEPNYARSTLLAPVGSIDEGPRTELNLLQRVCVIGRAPAGIQLLSDVSTSADESYRSAGASRLLGAVLRAARALGEDISFEVSNEATWARVERHFRAMLQELWEMRALRGRTPEEAFLVRCDRSTMTQADIDAGRILVHVHLEVAVAIEAIRVVLALSEGGRVALLTSERAS